MKASTRYWSSCEECIIGTYSQRHLRPASQIESTRPVLEALGDSSAPTRERTPVLGSLFRPAFQVCLHLSPHKGYPSPPADDQRQSERYVRTYVRASILSNIQTHWSLAEATSAPSLPYSWGNWKLDPYPESTQRTRVTMHIISLLASRWRLTKIQRPSTGRFSTAVYAF